MPRVDGLSISTCSREQAQARGQTQPPRQPRHEHQAGPDGSQHHWQTHSPQGRHVPEAKLGPHAHDAHPQDPGKAQLQAWLQGRWGQGA